LNLKSRRARVNNPSIDPVTHAEYVLVPAETYDRMRTVVDGVTKRAGWDDPALDEYERYRKPV
jgi:hypothetical protein